MVSMMDKVAEFIRTTLFLFYFMAMLVILDAAILIGAKIFSHLSFIVFLLVFPLIEVVAWTMFSLAFLGINSSILAILKPNPRVGRVLVFILSIVNFLFFCYIIWGQGNIGLRMFVAKSVFTLIMLQICYFTFSIGFILKDCGYDSY